MGFNEVFKKPMEQKPEEKIEYGIETTKLDVDDSIMNKI